MRGAHLFKCLPYSSVVVGGWWCPTPPGTSHDQVTFWARRQPAAAGGISSHLENNKIPFRCHSIYIMELSTRSTWLSIYYLHSELQCLVHRRAQVIMHKSPLQWRVIWVFRNVMWREEWKFRILESNIHGPTVKAFDGGGWQRISLLFSYRVTPKWFEWRLLPHFYHHITHIANKCTNALAM